MYGRWEYEISHEEHPAAVFCDLSLRHGISEVSNEGKLASNFIKIDQLVIWRLVYKQKYLRSKKNNSETSSVGWNEIKLIIQNVFLHAVWEFRAGCSKHLDVRQGNLKGFSLRRQQEILDLISPKLNFCYSPQTIFKFTWAPYCHHFAFEEMVQPKAPPCPQIFQDNSPPPFLHDSKSHLHPSSQRWPADFLVYLPPLKVLCFSLRWFSLMNILSIATDWTKASP